jgi:hypothetical protein
VSFHVIICSVIDVKTTRIPGELAGALFTYYWPIIVCTEYS